MSRNSLKNKPLLVGLTGGIGAGKSTVARLWKVLGIPVFNADDEAKAILDSNPEVRAGIVALLGSEAYEGQFPNRAYIARAVFANPEKLDGLNRIVHPAVGRVWQQWVAHHAAWPYLLKEAAIIFETGQQELYDAVILVTAPEAERTKRVLSRGGISEKDVKQRMAVQYTDEEKRSLSHYEIVNDGVSAVIPQVLATHEILLKKALSRSMGEN